MPRQPLSLSALTMNEQASIIMRDFVTQVQPGEPDHTEDEGDHCEKCPFRGDALTISKHVRSRNPISLSLR